MRIRLFLAPFFLVPVLALSQSLPADRVLRVEELYNYLQPEVREEMRGAGVTGLASYFRDHFSEHFFYDYRSLPARLLHYNKTYDNRAAHQARALDQMTKFSDSTQWVLPFDYLDGEPVNAYALRHLARQHKMVDVAFYYFNDSRRSELIQYFERQLHSLNVALEAGEYERIENGNGVYEAFRSGYRILNWLWIHNMFLNEAAYSDQDQLYTIATLLQHGQHLYERNDTFRSGNHQTRGVSALAMLAILFRDFIGTDLWLERAMKRLGEHMEMEINGDGFQFERSVHYHMSDINNYFYVYQLAKRNSIEVGDVWEGRLRGLFETLVKIGYPDRSAPVLQDDTEIPWAEKNNISGAMTLGYLLFEDPEFGYFATNKVPERVYWFLDERQVKMLDNISQKRPTYGSLAFDETGYFVMREGWDPDDKMLVVSAGLDAKKPDHQHGDMLGLQAMAHGHAILPNYQVRYSLEDFDFFKNSMVKNVALVDDVLQGGEWTSNKGGSGFGKFRKLPKPQVIVWDSNETHDLFVGRHDGFENSDVAYSRQVIFVKNDFWIVKDNFTSSSVHEYKQVWQGHYTHEEGANLLRANHEDASGHDIMQLVRADAVSKGGRRGKQWSVVSKSGQSDFSFVTIIYPYKSYDKRINEKQSSQLNAWTINADHLKMSGNNAVSVSSADKMYLFNTEEIEMEGVKLQFEDPVDFVITLSTSSLLVQLTDAESQKIIAIKTGGTSNVERQMAPGDTLQIDF